MENSHHLVVPGLLFLRRLPAAVPGWNDHYKLLQWYSSYKWALFLGYFILQIAQVNCKRLMLISEQNPLLSQIFLLFVPYFLIPTGWLPRWFFFLLSSCLRFWALLPGLSLPSSPTLGPFRLVHPFQYFLAYSTVSSVTLYSFMSNPFSPNVEQFLTILHSM